MHEIKGEEVFSLMDDGDSNTVIEKLFVVLRREIVLLM